jgi:hypothetical protein
MVILVDDDQISSLWVPRNSQLIEAYDEPRAKTEHASLWRHSLDSEQHTPKDYQSRERWSNHFDKESEARISALDM